MTPMASQLLTFASWIVALYSFRLGLLGNPTYQLLLSTPSGLLNRAMDCLEEAEYPDDGDLQTFLRELYRLKLIRSAIFVLEGGALFYLLLSDPGFVLTWIVVAKNIYVYNLLHHSLRQMSEQSNGLQAILDCPDSVRRWDRLNQILNGFCFLAILLHVQGVF